MKKERFEKLFRGLNDIADYAKTANENTRLTTTQGETMEPKLFGDLIASAKEAAEIAGGIRKPARVTVYPMPSPRAVRLKTGLNQREFADLLGVDEYLVKAWERGSRSPTRSALRLLMLLDVRPDIQKDLESLHHPYCLI